MGEQPDYLVDLRIRRGYEDLAGPGGLGDGRGADVVITAAGQQHPSLLDDQLRMAELYDVRNVASAFWIDETGRMVRANDPIYAQRRNRETGRSRSTGARLGRERARRALM